MLYGPSREGGRLRACKHPFKTPAKQKVFQAKIVADAFKCSVGLRTRAKTEMLISSEPLQESPASAHRAFTRGQRTVFSSNGRVSRHRQPRYNGLLPQTVYETDAAPMVRMR
jgi:hypothetical protein